MPLADRRSTRNQPCGGSSWLIFLRNIPAASGLVAAGRRAVAPLRGGVWARPAAPAAGQGRPKAGPKDRTAPLTRPPSAAGSAGRPRQRPVRGRVQGPGRGAAGEAVPTPGELARRSRTAWRVSALLGSGESGLPGSRLPSGAAFVGGLL